MVGPIGCPIKEAEAALDVSLRRVGYRSSSISISGSLNELLLARGICSLDRGDSELENKIYRGNLVRSSYGINSVLAGEAIQKIRSLRGKLSGATVESDVGKQESIPRAQHAFIINQLKRKEEIELLTRAFGRRFIQVSVATPVNQRLERLIARLRGEKDGWTNEDCERHAKKLIQMDQDEKDADKVGQQISKVFQLGDVFLDGRSAEALQTSSDRFIDVLFGKNSIGPTRDEYGQYVAKAASLRSLDLSRQVGAGVFSPEGDLISTGCNEVPKPGGGIYSQEDSGKLRDVDLGGEANKQEINNIIFSFLHSLEEQDLLRSEMTSEDILSDESRKDKILDSLIGGVTEYGRMVHAEMNAICDAARLGRALKGGTIYVTTYPCHNCAKHIVSSGIARIVFIEPYPKSKAEALFKNIIGPEGQNPSLVTVEHFYGISPRRFRDLFEKERRQTSRGEIEDWYGGMSAPRLGASQISSTAQELHAIKESIHYLDDTP